MNSKIIKYDDFILILIRKYGENLLKNKKYKIYEYCKEIDVVYEVFNRDIPDINFFYEIPKLKDFFNTCDDVYIYTQCNFVDYIKYELGFSVIKGKELSEFIKNYGGAFFNNFPIIFNLQNNTCYMHRFESPYGNDICIFRDYSNIQKKFLYKRLINILNDYINL